jgi:hypothetical protein
MEVRDKIELYCTRHSIPVWRMKYRQSIDILTRANEVVRNLRGGRRQLAGLPAQVEVNVAGSVQPLGLMILEDISDGGARLVGGAPITPGSSITFSVPGASFRGSGVVRHVQALQTSVAVLFSIGVEFEEDPTPQRSWLRFGKKHALTNGGSGAYVS